MSSQHHVFLSYSRTDTDLMTRIRDDLRSSGLSVYVDDGGASGTPALNRVINDRMRNANVFICLLSPEARASDTLIQKLAFAASLKKPLYMILVDGDEDSAVPIDYSIYPLIDLRADYERLKKELIPKLFGTIGLQGNHHIPKNTDAIKKLTTTPFDTLPFRPSAWKKKNNRTRNVLLLLLILSVSVYFLWVTLAPLIR
jgi:hypothetical protein